MDKPTGCRNHVGESLEGHTLRHQTACRCSMVPCVRQRFAILVLHPKAVFAEIDMANRAGPVSLRDLGTIRHLVTIPIILSAIVVEPSHWSVALGKSRAAAAMMVTGQLDATCSVLLW